MKGHKTAIYLSYRHANGSFRILEMDAVVINCHSRCMGTLPFFQREATFMICFLLP